MTQPIQPTDERRCTCLAWDPIYNDHSEAEHTACRPGGDPPCGGCDSCQSGMVAYAQMNEKQP